MRILTMSVAAIALTATGAMAEPGKGHKGHHDGNGAKAHVAAKMDRKDGPGKSAGASAKSRLEIHHGDAKRGNGGRYKAEKRSAEKRENDRQVMRVAERRTERKDERRDRDRDDWARAEKGGRNYVDRVVFERHHELLRDDSRRTFLNGCPPGLAKKRNGCTPPGLAKRDDRRMFDYDWQPRIFGLRSYDRGNYYYNDGYLVRLAGGNRISGYIPLLGGALAIGNPWPTAYRSYEVPQYYVDYYDLGAPANYRYADNVIYRVDAEDAAIMSIAALLTGDDFQIGQPMPTGYDVYNVPYSYRQRYYDTPDALYRYSDGYVYRIDPKTQLVAAAIDLLV